MFDRCFVISTVSDDPFAIDVAHFFGQRAEISDLISLKQFANSEFCPRFISDENSLENIGCSLQGKTVFMVSTCSGSWTRNELAMRNCLVASAAKDNAAEKVVLVEPDLFFSAQDRGPQKDQGEVDFERDIWDMKKFDGQPFSARLYARLLATSGVDDVCTIHNHSVSVERLFNSTWKGLFANLSPADLYANYLLNGDYGAVVDTDKGLVLCAPDGGAVSFVSEVYKAVKARTSGMLLNPEVGRLFMEKHRLGERQVEMQASSGSPMRLADVHGRDVVVLDDMVRTGSTVVECCYRLKEAGARKVTFVVTHFYSSDEVKENLNTPVIDEIVTTNTLPSILNRDRQGRLRKKMLVLKIEKWIADFLLRKYCDRGLPASEPKYAVDISSKNPRAAHTHR